jgi:nickel/cobalt transporter (NicO) family protein
LQKTIVGAGRSYMLETASQWLIVAVGLWMLWRAFRPHDHDHERSGPVLALVAGLVPCPLTTFIMTYAVANGLVVSGLILSGTFGIGMVATVAIFPLLAVLFRTRLLPVMARTETVRRRIGHLLEVGAALAVIFLGLWPLLRK